MTYTVRVTNTAADQLAELPAKARRQVREHIGRLAQVPRPRGAKRLQSVQELWRIRVGEYRVIYAVRDQELLVLVLRVGDRKRVYDRLQRLADDLR